MYLSQSIAGKQHTKKQTSKEIYEELDFQGVTFLLEAQGMYRNHTARLREQVNT